MFETIVSHDTPKKREDTSRKEELRVHTEITVKAIRFFQIDLEKILTDILKGKARFFGSKDRVTVRCFMLLNPDNPSDVPVFLTRPNEVLQQSTYIDRKKVRHELDEPIDNTIHQEIWFFWEQILREQPNSERALFFQKLLASGALYKRIEGVMKVILTDRAHPKVRLENAYLILNKFEPEKRKKVIAQLGQYGCSEVNTGSNRGERVSVEKCTLEFMLADHIEESAQKLSQVVTPRAVRLYRNLAFRFLTNPEANKSLPAYARFQEFQELLQKL